MTTTNWIGRFFCSLGLIAMVVGGMLVPTSHPLYGDPGGGGVMVGCDDAVCGTNCGQWLRFHGEPDYECWQKAADLAPVCQVGAPGQPCDLCLPTCHKAVVNNVRKCLCDT